MSDVQYGIADGTTWPKPCRYSEWNLRHSNQPPTNRLHIASVLAAYAFLVDPERTQKDAIESLKRARRAVAPRG